MTEQELRTLVRQAIARHAGSGTLAPSHLAPSHPHFAPSHLAPSHPHFAPSHLAPSHLVSSQLSSSHWLFPVPSGADEEGPCIIEPAVMCNHCGYCKSMGH